MASNRIRKNYVSLVTLLDAKVLTAGSGLTVTAWGKTYSGVLLETGDISFEDRKFKSPSSFSLYVKQKHNPTKASDDGWASIYYRDRALTDYRHDYANKSGNIQLEKRTIRKAKKAKGKKRQAKEMALRTPASRPNHANDAISPASPSFPHATQNHFSHGSSDEFAMLGKAGGDCRAKRPKRSMILPLAQPKHTWAPCKQCGKWRRVPVGAVDKQSFTCAHNPDERFRRCRKPQELCLDVVERVLYYESVGVFMSQSGRPPLLDCGPAEFYRDLASFLDLVEQQRERAQNVRTRHLRIDLFGLYKAVVLNGGVEECAPSNNYNYEFFNRLLTEAKYELEACDLLPLDLARTFYFYLRSYERAWALRDASFRSHFSEFDHHPITLTNGCTKEVSGWAAITPLDVTGIRMKSVFPES